MRLLAGLVLFLLPVSIFAQSVPPPGLDGSATVLHPSPGIDYLYNPQGTSLHYLKSGYHRGVNT